MPATSYTPPTPGTLEAAWGQPINDILNIIETALQRLEIALGHVATDDATAVAGRLAGIAGMRRLVIQADEDTGGLELRDGGGSQIVNMQLWVDAAGAPIAWVQNAGGLGVNDRLSTFRGLFHPPAWQADIYGYVRRNGRAEFAWDGPPGNMLSHADAAQELFEGARSATLGTWQIPFGAGSIALHSEDPMAPAPSGSFSSVRITANTTSLNAVVGLTALGVPVYPASAGGTYSVVGSIRADDTARDAAWGIQWFESDGTFISQSLGSSSATVLDEWSEKSSGGLTAPALTAWAAPILNIATTVSGEDFDVSAVAMYHGTETRYGPPFLGSGTYGVWGEAAVNDRWADSGTDTDYVCTTGGVPEVQVWAERTTGVELTSTNPATLGTVSPGDDADAARADHVHPTTGLLTTAALTSTTPEPVGTAAAGASSNVARVDHVHGIRRVVQIKLIDDATTPTTGDGKVIFVIPPELNGLNLVDADAYVTTVSSSGTPTFQIRNVTDAVDMLSTAITVDASEFTSYTAATPPVINAAVDDVATGDRIAIDLDVVGTGAKGHGVIMVFA